MPIFTKLSAAKAAASHHKQSEQEKPSTPRYTHVPTHAARDALVGGGGAYNTSTEARHRLSTIAAENARNGRTSTPPTRQALTAKADTSRRSVHEVKLPPPQRRGVVRTQSDLSIESVLARSRRGNGNENLARASESCLNLSLGAGLGAGAGAGAGVEAPRSPYTYSPAADPARLREGGRERSKSGPGVKPLDSWGFSLGHGHGQRKTGSGSGSGAGMGMGVKSPLSASETCDWGRREERDSVVGSAANSVHTASTSSVSEKSQYLEMKHHHHRDSSAPHHQYTIPPNYAVQPPTVDNGLPTVSESKPVTPDAPVEKPRRRSFWRRSSMGMLLSSSSG